MRNRFTVVARMESGETVILGNYLGEEAALRVESNAADNERIDEVVTIDWWRGITV